MPISSPPPLRSHRLALFVALAAAVPGIAPAQTLAHPGWTRSNFAAEPWYRRAIFYQVPSAASDFNSLAGRLDAMQSTGIDALIVTPPALPSLAGAGAPNDAARAIAAQSALDAFDNFTRQATARGIRVLAALPAAQADADLAGRARFWLTRGVAGLRLEIPASVSTQDRDAIAAFVRSTAASIAGQRIVLTDDDSAAPASAASRTASDAGKAFRRYTETPELHVMTLSGPLTASALRPQLARALALPSTLLDTRPRSTSGDLSALAPVLATLALATGSAALTDPVQPLVLSGNAPTPEPALDDADAPKPAPAPTPAQPPPGVYLPYVPYVPPARPQKKAAPPPPTAADPLTIWTAQLAALHHSNAALRTGAKIALDFDADNVLVWVARPASLTPQNPPVVVLCNLSAQPVHLSLADAMKKLNLHGFFLRKLLRSDDAMGAEDIDAVKLAPYSVFIGEIRR